MSMDNKTSSVNKMNENENQPSPPSSSGAANDKEDQPPHSSNVSPQSSSFCLRHPIQLGQLQWKGFPNRNSGLHHSPFLVIRPVGFANLFHRSGGIYIPHPSINNIASSLNQSMNEHYRIDISKIVSGEDTRTTLMIQNIPKKYTSEMLISELNNKKNHGTFDFIYFPKDLKNNCNCGYAFVNMLSNLHIVAFYKDVHGKKWDNEVATLAYAQIQGKSEELARRFNKTLIKPNKVMTRNYFYPAT